MYPWISWKFIAEPLGSVECTLTTTAPEHSGIVVVSLTMITPLHNAIIVSLCKTQSLNTLRTGDADLRF